MSGSSVLMLTATMPDLSTGKLIAVSRTGAFILTLHSDVDPYNPLGIQYSLVITVFRAGGEILGFVTLEQSSAMQNVLCAFSEDRHLNFGSLGARISATDFLDRAGRVLGDLFGILSTDWRSPPPADDAQDRSGSHG